MDENENNPKQKPLEERKGKPASAKTEYIKHFWKVQATSSSLLLSTILDVGVEPMRGECQSLVAVVMAEMNNVFDQAPVGEREAAIGLGATRWGVIRTVVLPFGRGGLIGGTMLGLGRALGETIAVLLVTSQDFHIRFHILDHGVITISALIANRFSDARGVQLDSLLAAGFVLFLMTLVVNTAAAIIVARSRSGAGVDL